MLNRVYTADTYDLYYAYDGESDTSYLYLEEKDTDRHAWVCFLGSFDGFREYLIKFYTSGLVDTDFEVGYPVWSSRNFRETVFDWYQIDYTIKDAEYVRLQMEGVE